jgi:hypothetical protein
MIITALMADVAAFITQKLSKNQFKKITKFQSSQIVLNQAVCFKLFTGLLPDCNVPTVGGLKCIQCEYKR